MKSKSKKITDIEQAYLSKEEIELLKLIRK